MLLRANSRIRSRNAACSPDSSKSMAVYFPAPRAMRGALLRRRPVQLVSTVIARPCVRRLTCSCMRTNLSAADLGDLLEQPLVATLATYRKNGEVLLSPIWFEWRDGGFNLIVGRKDFKTQHIERDPRASIAVYESALPLRGMEMRGTAKLFTKGLQELRTR